MCVSEGEAAERARAGVQAQIIECLNRFYAMETGLWGGPLDALIIRTIIVGDIQGRLYDLSALASVLDIPVSTVHRRVAELVERNFLERAAVGRSVYLKPTHQTRATMDRTFDDMVATLTRLYRGDIGSRCGSGTT